MKKLSFIDAKKACWLKPIFESSVDETMIKELFTVFFSMKILLSITEETLQVSSVIFKGKLFVTSISAHNRI